ncbi:MAG: RnfABCDGE type electron transport complex subunit D [Treponema sp.]|jgi:electron transport complex protein RnfD|nr:RnfABCDGE type electron transport complex subunit D [Treponema sp.]
MSDTKNEKPVKPGTAAPLLLLGSSPHIASPVSSGRIMACVLVSLAPAAFFGIILYGLPALFTIIASIAGAELGEFLFRKITGQAPRNGDLSAAVTGLLLALILPPATPLWMTALGAFFAIIIAKEFFGGLGANVFNPALVGRAFLLMSFPKALTSWTAPRISIVKVTADVLSGATSAADALSGPTPMAIIKSGGVLDSLGSGKAEILKTLFFGTHSGSIGESSILAILIGFVFLLVIRVIDWRTPVFMLATVALLSFFLGRDPLIAVLGGGVFFGAVFMATDYVTSPFGGAGKIIFGCGAGIIIVLIRQWGAYPEGVTYAILIMNAVTPFLNRILPKKYGFVKPVKGVNK